MPYWNTALITALFAGLFFYHLYRKERIPVKWLEFVIYFQVVVFFGFVFSRGATITEDYLLYGRLPIGSELLKSSFHWYGALFGFALAWTATSWFPIGGTRTSALFFFNSLSVTACLISAIGKIGCFLDGHGGCGGVATSLPWGVMYEWGTASSLIPLHPVQIYDSIVALCLLALLYWKVPIRWASVTFLVLWSLAQILMEYICPAQKVFLNGAFNLAQVTYLGILFLAALGFLGFKFRGNLDLPFGNSSK